MKKVILKLLPHQILSEPLCNKGTAFTQEERDALRLHGFLPNHISTIEEQVKRRYANFRDQPNNLAKYIFLTALQNRNEILFYRLLLEHAKEMVPLVYTPTVGDVSINYSLMYREPRGLYLAYPLKDKMEEIFNNFPFQEIDVAVVTDGERILGLGDLGIGGMAISLGKLILYSLFGGIPPACALPIVLDVGTNNKTLLEDPLYIGWRHERIRGKEYDEFIDRFIKALKRRYPNILLQWEDFAKPNAGTLLNRYRKQICSFNDDIQGTAAVVLAGIITAIKVSKSRLSDQKIALLGGGSAGIGICDQILRAIVHEGIVKEEEAKKLFYVVDIHGLIHTNMTVEPHQKPFAQDHAKIAEWKVKNPKRITLLDVIENVHPTILIGVSTQANSFTQEMVEKMAKYVKRPIIFPLSNPSSHSEAHPKDLLHWTKGEAIVATGSPFASVQYRDRLYEIDQCNNFYIFPGVGLGLIAAKATYVSDEIFLKAAHVLADHSPMHNNPYGNLFPSLDKLRDCNRDIAIEVAKQVAKEKNAKVESFEKLIKERMWFPDYPIFTSA
ncbi:MAG: NAD-dependent malic enzyme [Chlamydiae bacterium]|nr:NAD-dependent malic enzyme [Chlamydiota bacterium]